ncbi:unnamed protein product [Eruca vesicaria subsp. sativa]|uniref:Conserved oligomeric Golgi complex subunit 8 n=1 Tax=Eruca vesicaria subsp. sativa TaxID=29727 RepID=A0ABC8JWU3_ERUVS|nr:unnamed protein product [Eruca vesicaria subsp. sativa]
MHLLSLSRLHVLQHLQLSCQNVSGLYEMPLQFLRCLEAWLTGILEDLDQKNAYEYLKGMINCHRMHLFDVVNKCLERKLFCKRKVVKMKTGVRVTDGREKRNLMEQAQL